MDVTFQDFQKMEFAMGKIISCEKPENSEKMLKMEVDFGSEKKQVMAGLGSRYAPGDLEGRTTLFLKNLEPKRLMGMESQAMIMVADAGDDFVMLNPDKDVSPGTRVR